MVCPELGTGFQSPYANKPNCLVPHFDGAFLWHESKDALWARFFTGAPRRLRRSVERYSIVKESLRALSRRYGVNQKTVRKWKARSSVVDRRTGPKQPRSTVLSIEEEAVIVGFRRHTLLPLDDCLYALQPTIPHLTRSSLHRCLQRHGIGRLAQIESDKPAKKKFKSYSIGFSPIDIAEVQTAEGKLYLFVAIDRTSKFAFVQLAEKANRVTASAFLVALVKAVPYKIHTVLTDRASSSVCHRDKQMRRTRYDAHVRSALPRARYRTPIHQDQSSLDQRPGRTNEPHDQGRNRQTLSLRRSRPVAPPSRRLRRRLQFRTPSEDPQRPHAIRVRLKMLEFRTRPIHTQPTPSNAGTEHLVHGVHPHPRCCRSIAQYSTARPSCCG